MSDKKKWRWHNEGSNHWLKYDGDRSWFCRIRNGMGAYTVDAYCGVASFPARSLEDAIHGAESMLRKSPMWKEGDEVEPYHGPALAELLAKRGYTLSGQSVKRADGEEMTLSDVRAVQSVMNTHRSSTREYSDAPPV